MLGLEKAGEKAPIDTKVMIRKFGLVSMDDGLEVNEKGTRAVNVWVFVSWNSCGIADGHISPNAPDVFRPSQLSA